jgi:hypothetical protein
MHAPCQPGATAPQVRNLWWCKARRTAGDGRQGPPAYVPLPSGGHDANGWAHGRPPPPCQGAMAGRGTPRARRQARPHASPACPAASRHQDVATSGQATGTGRLSRLGGAVVPVGPSPGIRRRQAGRHKGGQTWTEPDQRAGGRTCSRKAMACDSSGDAVSEEKRDAAPHTAGSPAVCRPAGTLLTGWHTRGGAHQPLASRASAAGVRHPPWRGSHMRSFASSCTCMPTSTFDKL